jgi:serine/threonine protein kinase
MILMEYCDRGSLRDLLDTRQQVLSEDQTSVSCGTCLKDCSSSRRSIRSFITNILLCSGGGIEVAAFGISRRFDFGTT